MSTDVICQIQHNRARYVSELHRAFHNLPRVDDAPHGHVSRDILCPLFRVFPFRIYLYAQNFLSFKPNELNYTKHLPFLL